MEGETSWISHSFDDTRRNIGEYDSCSELCDEENRDVLGVSMDSILPYDLSERILACLPVASIVKAGGVCKIWCEIVKSSRFLRILSQGLPEKPWYFMFTTSDDPVGYAYDPTLRKWYGFELSFNVTSNWFFASSHGLVCFMDNDSRSELYVCNPITKYWKKLPEPSGTKFSDYSTLAIDVDRSSHNYSLSIVKSKQVPGNFFQWNLSIHIYNSETMTWVTPVTDVMTGWRGGDESVICDGVLYFLIYATGPNPLEYRHGLITYKLSTQPPHNMLIRSFTRVPCYLTCGRLMNLKEKLVLVGGIGKLDRPDIIKGIRIWVLIGREWKEIARMPHKFFQGFGEFDDVFASSGKDDLIYIQSYGAPALLVYDMNLRQWKWAQKCPVTKRFPLQLFTGFCFEPRLEISP